MKICSTIEQVRDALRDPRLKQVSIGLVPTMGALHAGHLSLVRAAKSRCGLVVVSIFVNPTQFAPTEDLAKYPRSLERDCEMLRGEGTDVVFTPSADEMYGAGASTWVTVEGLSERLDGASRPGHFRGVTTVVSKLFHIVGPNAAFFGQKDAAQLAIVRRMTRDLNLPIEIVGCPIVREVDGLAMSSRNVYLSGDERRQARVLSRCLERMRREFEHGERESAALIEAGKQTLAEEPAVRLDYLSIVDPDSLEAVERISGRCLAAGAAYVGTTRLIDNLVLSA